MQQLELTEKHKEQLLEMCNKLFPKKCKIAKNNKINSQFLLVNSNLDFSILDFNSSYKGSYSDQIHWYEFINTYLAEKVLNPNPKKPNRNQKQIFCDFFWNNNIYWYYCQEGSLPLVGNPEILHPIDYLYKQFKLLKLK